MCPIHIVLRKDRPKQPTTNNEIRSRCGLCVFDLGRSCPGVCFTGNAHICSSSSIYRDSGVSFRRLGSVSLYDHSFCSTLLLLQIISLVGTDQTCPPNYLHLAGPLSQLSHLPWACTNMQRIWWWCKGFPYWKSYSVSSPFSGLHGHPSSADEVWPRPNSVQCMALCNNIWACLFEEMRLNDCSCTFIV